MTIAHSSQANSAPGATGAELAGAIRRLARGSVLVVGDAMLERTVYGEVGRVSPEAPVPVLVVRYELATPGGAGAIVRNLGALGVAVAFVSVVGDDQPGADLTGLIGGQPGVEPWLLVQGGRVTTLKTRFVAPAAPGGQQLLRADREETSPIHPKLADRLLRIARDAMAATSVTILSDRAKGVLAGDVPARLIEAAWQVGRRIVADLRGAAFARYAGADVVVARCRDVVAPGVTPPETDGAVAAGAAALRERHGFGAVLVRRGAAGLTLAHAGGIQHFSTRAAEVADGSGVGDTVVAVFGAALAAGLDLPMAARLASIAGGVAVSRIGNAVVREADLLLSATGMAEPAASD
jgi:D-beta-D-heptose 7-phosphate kinase/D-beta-D-heptose 1-phosphate adenosyltransferase